MRSLQLIFTAFLTFLFVINAVFWRKAIAILLCGVLSFNSASCYSFWDSQEKVDAAVPPCTIAQGSPLNELTSKAVSNALTSQKNKRCIAYEKIVKVGGSISWRANNPGNLRDASTKIADAPGGEGTFAVFPTMEDGHAAQKTLYLRKYGEMSVKNAAKKLTPPSENNTEKYLKDLEAQGINLDGSVKSQIDKLTEAVKKIEGFAEGIEVPRSEEAPCNQPNSKSKSENKEEPQFCIATAHSSNDPHLVTFDGLKYDLQTVGEVILIKSNHSEFEVQARQTPWNNSASVSINSAIAIKVGSDRVALYAQGLPDDDTTTPLRVNGKPTTIQGNKLALTGGGEILKQGGNYVISAPTGEKVLVSSNGSFLNLSPIVHNRSGKYSGLLGNVNGNPKDDLQVRDGKNVLEARSTYGDVKQVVNLVGLRLPGVLDRAEQVYFDRLYKEFANSWRVKQEESLFDYPAGKTTKSYLNPGFPDKYLTLNMLSADQIQKAQNACTEAKVTEDLMEGCIFDVGFSGFTEFARTTAEISGYIGIVNQLIPVLNIPTPDQIGNIIKPPIIKVPKICVFGACL